MLFPRLIGSMMRFVDEMHIKNYLLIWRGAGLCLLDIPYANPIKLDSDMLAGLLHAIQQVMNDGIKSITWKHQKILFEFADDLLHVLIMDSKSNQLHYETELINVRDRISKRFQQRPEWMKLIKRGQIQNVRTCALDVIQSFHLRGLDYNLTPKLQENHKDIPFATNEFIEMMQFLMSFIDGKRSIYQIIQDSDLAREMVLGLLSVLLLYDWIELIRVTGLNDRLKLAREPRIFEINNLGPRELLREVCSEFRFPSSAIEVAEKLGLDPYVVLFIAGKLLDCDVLIFHE
jgi:hypothetical protein